MKLTALTILLALSLFGLFTGASQGAASASEIEADVNATLARFERHAGGARELLDRAAAVLVFPTVVKAGIGIGGEYGEGVLRIGGRTQGYYNIVSGSAGFQLGVEERSIILMFMTDDALQRFRRKDGWSIGVDASVALITIGAGGTIDTNQIKSPVIAFVFDTKGLMYNLTLEGTKISRITR